MTLSWGGKLAARPPSHRAALRLVEVEVVAMGFVVIGGEGGGEEAAGAVADVVGEAGFLSLAAPVGGEGDGGAGGEAEAGDVDGVGRGMLAPAALGAAVEAAAA